jgi:hypothetical protein
MAQPTEKVEGIDRIITRFFGFDRKEAILNNVCGWCKKPAIEFRDELSEQEYRISAMCQQCQDETFKKEDEYEQRRMACSH